MIPSNYTTRKNTRVVASGGSHVTAATVNGIDIGLQPNYLSHHAGGKLNGWQRGNILKDGREALLLGGIKRAETWAAKFSDKTFAVSE